MPGYVAVSGLITGTPAGTVTVGPYTSPGNTSALFESTTVVLASGTNTIAIPSYANGVIIMPPTSNLIGITIKGVGGDTGIPMSPSEPAMISFPATPPASFVLSAASAMTLPTQVIFY